MSESSLGRQNGRFYKERKDSIVCWDVCTSEIYVNSSTESTSITDYKVPSTTVAPPEVLNVVAVTDNGTTTVSEYRTTDLLVEETVTKGDGNATQHVAMDSHSTVQSGGGGGGENLTETEVELRFDFLGRSAIDDIFLVDSSNANGTVSGDATEVSMRGARQGFDIVASYDEANQKNSNQSRWKLSESNATMKRPDGSSKTNSKFRFATQDSGTSVKRVRPNVTPVSENGTVTETTATEAKIMNGSKALQSSATVSKRSANVTTVPGFSGMQLGSSATVDQVGNKFENQTLQDKFNVTAVANLSSERQNVVAESISSVNGTPEAMQTKWNVTVAEDLEIKSESFGKSGTNETSVATGSGAMQDLTEDRESELIITADLEDGSSPSKQDNLNGTVVNPSTGPSEISVTVADLSTELSVELNVNVANSSSKTFNGTAANLSSGQSEISNVSVANLSTELLEGLNVSVANVSSEPLERLNGTVVDLSSKPTEELNGNVANPLTELLEGLNVSVANHSTEPPERLNGTVANASSKPLVGLNVSVANPSTEPPERLNGTVANYSSEPSEELNGNVANLSSGQSEISNVSVANTSTEPSEGSSIIVSVANSSTEPLEGLNVSVANHSTEPPERLNVTVANHSTEPPEGTLAKNVSVANVSSVPPERLNVYVANVSSEPSEELNGNVANLSSGQSEISNVSVANTSTEPSEGSSIIVSVANSSTEPVEGLNVSVANHSTESPERLNGTVANASSKLPEGLNVSVANPSAEPSEELNGTVADLSTEIPEILNVSFANHSTEPPERLNGTVADPSTEPTEILNVDVANISTELPEELNVTVANPSTELLEGSNATVATADLEPKSENQTFGQSETRTTESEDDPATVSKPNASKSTAKFNNQSHHTTATFQS
ncbi:Uncharacterised protein g9909 [Pycnogonum litorale]